MRVKPLCHSADESTLTVLHGVTFSTSKPLGQLLASAGYMKDDLHCVSAREVLSS